MDILTARKIAEELYTASTDRLREFSKTPGIFLSLPALIGLQRLQGCRISAGELLVLNGLARSFSSSPESYAAGSVISSDRHIADTLADMMSKYAFLYPDYSAPCTAQKAFEIGGEAVAYGKVKSFSMSDTALFSSSSDELAKLEAALGGFDPKYCQNGICMGENLYIHKEKHLRLGKSYSVSFAFLKENADFDNLLSFAGDVSAENSVVSAFASKRSDLLGLFCDRSKRFLIMAEGIPGDPFINEDPELTESEKIFISTLKFFFENDPNGYAIAIISKPRSSSKTRLEALAEKHGIEIFHPIEITKFPRISVLSKGKTVSSLPSSVLRTISKSEALKVEIPSQSTSTSLPEVNIYEHNQGEERLYTACVPLSDGTSFADIINAVALTIIEAAYKGYNTKNSEISIAINAKIFMSSESVGSSYAAILGVYRAITEMGLSVDSSSLSLTNIDPSVSVALKVRAFKEPVSTKSRFSPHELLISLTNDIGIPDFSDLLALINGQNI